MSRIHPDPKHLWQQAELSRLSGNAPGSVRLYEALTRFNEWAVPANLRLAQLAGDLGNLRASVAHALRAADPCESDAALVEAVIHQLVRTGELEAGCALVDSPAIEQCIDGEIFASLGQQMLAQSMPELALRLLQRATQLGVDDAGIHYRLGLCAHYLGELDLATESLARAIHKDPGLIPAYWARSKLRRVTTTSNHVDSLRQALARNCDREERFLLHYALFKELDELDDTNEAWPHLATALKLQRAVTPYDEPSEIKLFAALSTFRPSRPASTSFDEGPQPIMVLGQPRSGSSLIENLLARHPQIKAAGELRDFFWQLRWETGVAGNSHLDATLVEAATHADWQRLGTRYLAHTRWHSGGRSYYIDKMPTHFLAIGMILRALPGARIIHTARDPMETCFSGLKEPFAGAYPHANDPLEMARHHLRYQKLMRHWRDRFGQQILDMEYASVVADPEAGCLAAWQHCGLARPERTPTAREVRVTTASAAQVREPVHSRSIGRWRHYARQLDGMRSVLDAD